MRKEGDRVMERRERGRKGEEGEVNKDCMVMGWDGVCKYRGGKP